MPTRAPSGARGVIEYDGTNFAGSQRQPNARTVQGELEEVLNRLTGERITIRFAGRTDAGVHATGQVVAFVLPAEFGGTREAWAETRRLLNAALPRDVRFRSLRSARPGFDPRRAAVARVYRYRIRSGGDGRPTDRHRTLEIPDRPDVAAMQAAAARLVGERDYAALGSDVRGSTVRHLSEVTVVAHGTLIEIRVTGNAFLKRMVRSLVAVLLEVGRGRLAADEVEAILVRRERALHGRAVPALGLTLERVIYQGRNR